MGTEFVPETSEDFHTLTQLFAREHCIEYRIFNEKDDVILLGCYAMSLGLWLTTFRKATQPDIPEDLNPQRRR